MISNNIPELIGMAMQEISPEFDNISPIFGVIVNKLLTISIGRYSERETDRQ